MEGGQRVQFDCGLGKFHWQKDYHMTCQWTKIQRTKAHPWHQYVVFWPVCHSSFLCVTSFFCVCVLSLVSPATTLHPKINQKLQKGLHKALNNSNTHPQYLKHLYAYPCPLFESKTPKFELFQLFCFFFSLVHLPYKKPQSAPILLNPLINFLHPLNHTSPLSQKFIA